jgi:hypothetical protein
LKFTAKGMLRAAIALCLARRFANIPRKTIHQSAQFLLFSSHLRFEAENKQTPTLSIKRIIFRYLND